VIASPSPMRANANTSVRQFVSTQISALNTLKSKTKVFQDGRYTTPYIAALRRNQAADDTLAFAMLDRLSNCLQEAQTQKGNLDDAYQAVTTKFTIF
jgi:hypothetical protein